MGTRAGSPLSLTKRKTSFDQQNPRASLTATELCLRATKKMECTWPYTPMHTPTQGADKDPIKHYNAMSASVAPSLYFGFHSAWKTLSAPRQRERLHLGQTSPLITPPERRKVSITTVRRHANATKYRQKIAYRLSHQLWPHHLEQPASPSCGNSEQISISSKLQDLSLPTHLRA